MPIPKKAGPINHSIMREEVYNSLLAWIKEGVLRPGEKLLDTELARSLGVSRTPVREALRRLADKGLVETSANRWTRVADVSTEQAELIYPIIWTLEELAASLVLDRLDDQDFQELEQANRELARAIESRRPVEASRADSRFHAVLIEKTQNPYLIEILTDLKVKHRRLEVHYFEGCASASDSVREHAEIIAALREHHLERVRELIRHNWQKSLKRLLAVSSRRGDDAESQS